MYSCYVSLAMIVLAPIIRHKRIKDVAINVYPPRVKSKTSDSHFLGIQTHPTCVSSLKIMLERRTDALISVEP